ncbi:MAG: hypothetical protein ABTQ73_07410 [Caldilineales bacterium]
MITDLFLTWALVAISLANTILMLWLGSTLVLNAAPRSWGVMTAAAGFFLGALFFISHSALLLSPSLTLTRSNTLWLAVGITPVVILPFVWYAVLLWYAGFWAGPAQSLRRHRLWLTLLALTLLAGVVALATLGLPYVPLLRQLSPWIWPLRELVKTPLPGTGIPLIALAFAGYVLVCVLLSLDVLRRPGPTERLLGDLARQRARPWLAASSILFVAVGLMVAVGLVWTILNTKIGNYYIIEGSDIRIVAGFDLVISLLITGVVVALGQGITAYELFTGKALPRRALARHWRRALFLAAGYGSLTGGALALGLEPVYVALATAVLMTLFFALLSWRVYAEWDYSVQQLRPFVTSANWYDALVAEPEAGDAVAEPFAALCEQVLQAGHAYLLPLGSIAGFVRPHSYPPDGTSPVPGTLSAALSAARVPLLAVDPAVYGGAQWAVPLRRERGLVGALLLGPQRDGGLYTLEQIEIARAAGERLLDAAAGVELSRRLMRLQRERMAATQHLDQRTRRVLHDEVLPLIHTSLLQVAAGAEQGAVQRQLADAHQQVANLLRDLPAAVAPEVARLGLLPALRRMIEVEFAPAFATVTWQVEPEAEAAAAQLSLLAAETVYYATRELVRNAARHAQPLDKEPLQLALSAAREGAWWVLAVEDNGRTAAWPAAPVAGHGLELHSTLMAIAGGALVVEALPDGHTRGRLVMPVDAERK